MNRGPRTELAEHHRWENMIGIMLPML